MGSALLFGLGLGLLLAASALGLWRLDQQRTRRNLAARQRPGGAGLPPPVLPVVDLAHCLGCGTCVEACPEEGVLDLVHGQAAVVRPARCVGHGHCATACPVGAIELQVPEAGTRRDIPVVSEELEADAVPGLFLAGEVTARALIRPAILQGAAVASTVARRKQEGSLPALPAGHDLVVVGAGPAGLACALAGLEQGLDVLLLDRETAIGGTVARYPAHKLVLTEPVDLPLVGRLAEREYEKEELIALWQEAAARHAVPFQGATTLQHVTAVPGGGFALQTDRGEVAASAVCLAVGRRGLPRRLSVPGEELGHVRYELRDPAALAGRAVVVVGGGDSAVEAALALGEAEARVLLVHRGDGFPRLRARNSARLEAAVAAQRVQVRLATTVVRIAADHVVLRSGDAAPAAVRCDDVFVLIGGELPVPMLERCGVSFDPARRPRPDAQDPGERRNGLRRALAAGALCAAAVVLFAGMHSDYYTSPPHRRAADPLHAELGPGQGLGLWFGIAGVALIAVNLLYLLRRPGTWLRLGSLRGWMSWHVLTGYLALGTAALHAGFLPRDTSGGHAFWALLVLVMTGVIGRYFYAFVPRAANGRELELAAVKAQVAELSAPDPQDDEFYALARAEVLAQVERRQWGGSLPGRLLALLGMQWDRRALLRRLQDQGERSGVPSERLQPLLQLADRAHRSALSVAHCEDLRALMSGWRWLHRWVALLMVALLCAHIALALMHGTLLAGGAG